MNPTTAQNLMQHSLYKQNIWLEHNCICEHEVLPLYKWMSFHFINECIVDETIPAQYL